MGIKKTKPLGLPRLHEMQIREIVAKSHKVVLSSRKRIHKSKTLSKASLERLERQPKKK